MLFSLSWIGGFDSRAAHLEFVVDTITLGQGFPESFWFTLSISFSQCCASIHSSITDDNSRVYRQCLYTRHIK